jgi:nucleotide-binding universal stress UspA family protein
MTTLLVPVDGSESSARAVQAVIKLYRRFVPMDVRLLHVQRRDSVPSEALGESGDERVSALRAGRSALAASQTLLEQAGFACTSDVRDGYVPSVIVAYAKETQCDAIVMGTRGMGSTADLIGSIARQVISLCDLPVTLVK